MAASNDLEKLIEDAIATRTFEVEWQGQRLTIEAARKAVAELQKTEKKAAAEEKRKEFDVSAGLSRAQQRLTDATRNFDALKGQKSVTSAQLRAADNAVKTAQAEVDRLSGTTTQTAPTQMPAQDSVARIGAQRITPPTVAPISGTPSQAPAPSGGGGTSATAGMTPRERRAATNWEARVQAEAGEYAYLLDPKFEGVADLLRKAVSQNWFKSDEGKAQFVQELQATAYGRNTSKKQQAFDTKSPGEKTALVQAEVDKIRAEYGEIQLDQGALEEVATAAARNGASDIERGRLVYRAAFKRGAAAPDYTAPVAARTALGGEDADRIRTIYRAYGVKADDQQIARILAQETDPVTGTVMTEDMLRNNLRDLAKVSYQPFADLLDRGLSVETIFSPYQQIAARVLEKAPDEVSLTNANGVPTEFATALMGEKPMSLTDWITRLKSDERYGWQFTSEAKQKATNLVMDLEKAFGFRA
jgi:hypothetical protein